MPGEEPVLMRKAGGLWSEFKQFALKGNVIDLAVAVVVGNAFSGVVNALVANIITPLTSLIGNPESLHTYAVTLRGPVVGANGSTTPTVLLNYGNFLQSIESFIIVTGSIFFMIKLIAAARGRLFAKEAAGEVAPSAPPSAEAALLAEIRDLLKEQGGKPGV